MKTVDIRGKAYVPVNERLKEFRKLHPGYSLRTELVNVNDESALVKAVIRDENDRIIAEGTAHERVDQKGSMVNSTSHVENAETSAWGRALGNFGIGIDASVATADEVAHAIAQQDKPRVAPAPKNHAHSGTIITISELCRELGYTVQDVYKAAKIVGVTPTPDEAEKIIRTLQDAKAKLATPKA